MLEFIRFLEMAGNILMIVWAGGIFYVLIQLWFFDFEDGEDDKCQN